MYDHDHDQHHHEDKKIKKTHNTTQHNTEAKAKNFILFYFIIYLRMFIRKQASNK
jgi:hypothetical protein